MINLKEFDSKKLFKSKLLKLVGITLIAVIASSIVFTVIKDKKNKEEATKKEDAGKKIKITTTKEVVTTDELWKDSVESKIKEQGIAQEKKLKSQIAELQAEIAKSKKEKDVGNDSYLVDRVTNLTREVGAIKAKNNISIKETAGKKSNEISQYHLNLENSQNSDNYKTLKTADNYIPAGSFARAILLSGVDAETGLNSATDPDPILIRITDHGTLPRKFKSDLKDCHIIGSAYGNLSSERAKIRIEKLSCTEIATAEIIETEVAGYITGEDGRAGIRGEVVSTEGKLLGNSFLAGMLGGFSNTLNPNQGVQQPTIVFKEDGNNKLPTPSINQKVREGLSAGASNSMDRLSKYYIDRAESLQPIVQVGAGRKVDVIFTEGVFFGSSELKKAIAKKRDEAIKRKSSNADLSGTDLSGEDRSVIRQLN